MEKQETAKYNAAIYVRLSKEDVLSNQGKKAESNSISNQDVICRGWFLPPNTIT